ncbi:MAG: hypothetical protein CVU56_04415 [Deltaproteobacteria bacterium HGW-Deltaproteobacteria-14]|jgi:pantoate kinase|nr:MAG: hypothetical protein CVU56_04415 [Deltaproteobacteria bacterium HGW-Deltaproteobacteria-14]
MKKLLLVVTLGVSLASFSSYSTSSFAAEPKSKFYDFSDQLIDGEIRKPTTLYSNVRQAAKFTRMLSLKKELLPLIFQARKERVFK